MDDSDAVLPAVAEAVGFLAYFKDLADPRQPGKVTYPLEEVLLLCLTATLAGAAHITEIALFGETRIDLLRIVKDTGQKLARLTSPDSRKMRQALLLSQASGAQ